MPLMVEWQLDAGGSRSVYTDGNKWNYLRIGVPLSVEVYVNAICSFR